MIYLVVYILGIFLTAYLGGRFVDNFEELCPLLIIFWPTVLPLVLVYLVIELGKKHRK